MTDWSSSYSNPDISDKPRLLTEEEIEAVLSHVPMPISGDKLSATYARNDILTWMRSILEEKPIAPSALQELVNNIVNQFHKSIIHPGTPVAALATEAVGANTTQATLNSVAGYTQILIRDGDKVIVTKIGTWIDELMDTAPLDKIVEIPENNTLYLELEHPVEVCSPYQDGRLEWSKVTAVTKHLPPGNCVLRMTTESGRTVDASTSKSFLVWDENIKELVHRSGPELRVGDKVPIIRRLPEVKDPIEFLDLEELFGRKLLDCKKDDPVLHDLLTEGHLSEDYLYPREWTCNINSKIPKRLPLDWGNGFMFGFAFRNINEDVKGHLGIKAKDWEKRNIFTKNLDRYKINYDVDRIHIIITNPLINVLLDKTVRGQFVHPSFKMAPKDFLLGFFSGLWSKHESFYQATRIHYSKDFLFMLARIGIFGSESKTGIMISDDQKYASVIKGCRPPIAPSLEAIGDVVLDRISAIKLESFYDHVYDLTVPSTLNFSLLNGLCVADTFHKSGSVSSVSFGIGAIRSIIFAAKKPANNFSTVFFNGDFSYEDVLMQRNAIVGSMVYDFVKDYQIDKFDNLEKQWWHTPDFFPNLPTDGETIVLRLKLNLVEMYRHQVTIQDIVDTINRDPVQAVDVYYGPNADAIIDMTAKNNTINDKVKEVYGINVNNEMGNWAAKSFFETSVIQRLKQTRVKGIKDITGLVPMVFKVTRVFVKEQGFADNTVKITLNRELMTDYGVTPQKIQRLFETCDVNVVEQGDGYVLVERPIDAFIDENGDQMIKYDNKYYTPVNYTEGQIEIRYPILTGVNLSEKGPNGKPIEVGDYTSVDDKFYREPKELLEIEGEYYELTSYTGKTERMIDYINKKINRLRRKGKSDIDRASEIIYAEVGGTNLPDLLTLPIIDKKRTTCQNMHTIAKTLGIEACRSFLIRVLADTIAGSGGYVHPTNIILIVEFIVSRGEPFGATFTGISRQPGGHISLATLEKAVRVFSENAFYGRKEDIRNTSAAVAMGHKISIGSGFFDIGQEVDGDILINDQIFTNVGKIPEQPDTISAEDVEALLSTVDRKHDPGTILMPNSNDEAIDLTQVAPLDGGKGTRFITVNAGVVQGTVRATTDPVVRYPLEEKPETRMSTALIYDQHPVIKPMKLDKGPLNVMVKRYLNAYQEFMANPVVSKEKLDKVPFKQLSPVKEIPVRVLPKPVSSPPPAAVATTTLEEIDELPELNLSEIGLPVQGTGTTEINTTEFIKFFNQ